MSELPPAPSQNDLETLLESRGGPARAPLPTARLGAGRHSACSPWGQVLSEIKGAPPAPGRRDQEDPLPGSPRSTSSSPGWAVPAATSQRQGVPQGPGHLPTPSLCPLSTVFTGLGSFASV